ncbi:hypothetical protein, partial [Roseovarius sp. ZX-A-9]|uniref:hypothetical protein n=1 Tax=Roseovarius sp. ZX-A-9 TaxID=3014783 RepID=UPI002330193E
NELSGGSLLDADYPNTGVNLACRFTKFTPQPGHVRSRIDLRQSTDDVKKSSNELRRVEVVFIKRGIANLFSLD